MRGPVDGTRAFDGVPVREAVALEAALNGFVGDLAGDCNEENVSSIATASSM